MITSDGLEAAQNRERQQALLLVASLRLLGWSCEEILSRLKAASAALTANDGNPMIQPPSAWKTDSDPRDN